MQVNYRFLFYITHKFFSYREIENSLFFSQILSISLKFKKKLSKIKYFMDIKTSNQNQFGQRYLRDESRVFEYNAWDGVDWPEEEEKEIQKKLENQRACPTQEDIAFKLLENPQQHWEIFYQTHTNKFFMDRKWLAHEFPELFQSITSESKVKILDVGCGVGNTTIPLLESNPNLFIYSCDFSEKAIETMANDDRISTERCFPFVWDITGTLTEQIAEASLDYILCIYVLSAIPPDSLKTAIGNLIRLLKPGGMLFVKDYGRHDLTQLRFKSGRLIHENFYRRGDGTLVYFFTNEELHQLFQEFDLTKLQNVMDKRLVVNRAKQIKMYRRWIQCKYIKNEENKDPN